MDLGKTACLSNIFELNLDCPLPVHPELFQNEDRVWIGVICPFYFFLIAWIPRFCFLRFSCCPMVFVPFFLLSIHSHLTIVLSYFSSIAMYHLLCSQTLPLRFSHSSVKCLQWHQRQVHRRICWFAQIVASAFCCSIRFLSTLQCSQKNKSQIASQSRRVSL